MLRTIGEKPIRSTTSALLEIAPFLEDDELVELTADAMAKVADAAAIPTLRKSLAQKNIPGKIVAIRGLSKAAGRSARDELRTLYRDSNPRIVLAAAHGSPSKRIEAVSKSSLGYSRLRTSPFVRVPYKCFVPRRARSWRLNPFRKPDEQKAEIDAWKTWLTTHSQTAELKPPLKLSPLSEDLGSGSGGALFI